MSLVEEDRVTRGLASVGLTMIGPTLGAGSIPSFVLIAIGID